MQAGSRDEESNRFFHSRLPRQDRPSRMALIGSSATAFRGTSSASAGRRSASRLGSPQKGTRVIWVEKAGLSKLDRRVLPGASAQIAGANPVSDLRPVEHAAAARREI